MPKRNFNDKRLTVAETTQVLSVRLPIRTVEILKELALADNITHNEYLRILVSEHVYRLQGIKKSERDIKQVVDYARHSLDKVTKLEERVQKLETLLKACGIND